MQKKRVLIKVSGEYLRDDKSTNILDLEKLESLALQIRSLTKNYEIGIVVGGGNIWRGKVGEKIGMDRAQADYMGMLATIMNALAIQNALEMHSVEAVVYSAIEAPKVAEPYIRRNAINNLRDGKVAIFAGGTGYAFFTTDTAAALRAADIGADYILMAKHGVDGVYNADPKKDSSAKLFTKLTHSEIISLNLTVMDQTALTVCRENDIKILVFNILRKDSIIEVLKGSIPHTLIDSGR